MANKKPDKASASDTLLIELLTEELPPKSLKTLAESFGESFAKDLEHYGFLNANSNTRCFATPRRLAVSISQVMPKAPDLHERVTGPSVKAPVEAIAGFARKHGVDVQRLTQIDTPKGKAFALEKKVPGFRIDDFCGPRIGAALKALPIPKMMRWGDGDAQFARPVHGLVVLHGSRVVPGEVLGVKGSNKTLGHRFLSGSVIVLKHADDYERALRHQGKVIVDFAGRRAEITGQLEKAAGGAQLVVSDALLDEICALVESPTVYAGGFDAGFLAVPEECLILSMQQHQRYVPLRDNTAGKLLPRFLFVSNIETKQPREIIHGNERVLGARLSDAKFFYDQDRKTRLETRVPRLANVIYHNKLGSQLDHVRRIKSLAGRIANQIGADQQNAEHAGWLSKADLLTEMVGEFPELQGFMGRYYALHDGEPKEVADAIAAHYRPRFAGDALPAGPVSVAVALADKLDALAGLFGIGQTPTGDRDPFGLRRAALGVIRILIEQDLPLSLHDLVNAAFAGYSPSIGAAHTDLEAFVFDRLSGYLRDRGYSALEVDSVLSVQHVRINDTVRQLEAVRAFNKLPEAQSLAAANKRVINILKQAEAKGESFANVGLEELREPAERALFEALTAASRRAAPLLKQGDFTGYLKSFAVLKSPVDAFFDSVMVMVEDSELRKSRLALLADLRKQMNQVADISKLAA